MRIRWMDARMLLSAVVLAAGACATEGGSSNSPASPGASRDASGVAAGAVEDTLEACLARIPSDASAGQRLLAEESCRRDQANRK